MNFPNNCLGLARVSNMIHYRQSMFDLERGSEPRHQLQPRLPEGARQLEDGPLGKASCIDPPPPATNYQYGWIRW
jgi:hypothetical protein